ncbi:MAG: nicotinate-nucleotide adenylyltransferase [Candidatus Omnitrophica bacterium]|nr:nicotinate-nucleotide adenylyltransferase [Candidatus Omnitrophota bacterium]
MRIGLLGGTFNPPHYGHLILAQWCQQSLGLDKVVFVPAYIPPHKSVRDNRALLRYRMLKLACNENSLFEVSDIEVRRKEVSYSVYTIQRLRASYGKKAKIFFLIGADSYNDLHTWKDVKEIRKLASFVAVNRPGYKIKNKKETFQYVKMPQIDISSSLIRKRVRSGMSIKYLTPDAVIDLISRYNMYK